ncbi:MAG: carboxylate-amine ligase [Chloroflexi bacterium]|nr:carboxylate-amine ligase [Chloroflexota bacterium]
MFNVPLDLGVEEEYQIIDLETRELKSYVQEFIGRQRVQGQGDDAEEIKHEFMQSQIEVGTRICRDVNELREEIRRLRRHVIGIGDQLGVGIVAAATHPFSRWQDQAITASDRYIEFAQDMQHVVRSLLIFGMHVHIGFGGSPEQRELMINVMNDVRYFLPHILSLSTSSPFWMGHKTGLKSYRSIVFKAMPRTGIPMAFASWSDYANLVNIYAKVGALGKDITTISDATRIWWDVRPHPKYNTLEFRIADLTTTIDETICIAALYQAIVAKLIRLRQNNVSWRFYPRDLLEENKWRAVRYGVEGQLIDFGREIEVPLPDLIDELVELVDDVVDDLGSREEVAYARSIARSGSSADRQIRCFDTVIEQGGSEQDALHAVVDLLAHETRQGVEGTA